MIKDSERGKNSVESKTERSYFSLFLLVMASIDGLMFDWALINGQDRGRKLTSHAEEQYNINEEVRKFKLCLGSGK